MKSTVHYKVIHGKKVALCDYHGCCINKAYKEVYPKNFGAGTRNSGWSYLCIKHFKQELKKHKRHFLGYCSVK